MDRKNSIFISFYDNDGKHYSKGVRLEGNWVQNLYLLLNAMAKTMRNKSDFSMFCDLKNDMDGVIRSCSFEINKERADEIGDLEKLNHA